MNLNTPSSKNRYMTLYNICVEYYDVSCEDGPIIEGSSLSNKFTGNVLYKINIADEQIEDTAKQILSNLLSKPIAEVKTVFPIFSKIAQTKQFWFHIFPRDSSDFGNDILIDKDMNVLFNPPDRFDPIEDMLE